MINFNHIILVFSTLLNTWSDSESERVVRTRPLDTKVFHDDEIHPKFHVSTPAFGQLMNLVRFLFWFTAHTTQKKSHNKGGQGFGHSCILISGSSFIFADEMNHFKYYLMSSASCLTGFTNTKL